MKNEKLILEALAALCLLADKLMPDPDPMRDEEYVNFYGLSRHLEEAANELP